MFLLGWVAFHGEILSAFKSKSTICLMLIQLSCHEMKCLGNGLPSTLLGQEIRKGLDVDR